jgi:hypothetical protein
MTATAHQLARLVSTMVKPGTASVAQGMAAYEPRDQERVVPHVTRRANTLGDALVSTAEGASAEPPGSRGNSLEGPPLSRDRLSLGADAPMFSAVLQSASGHVVRLHCRLPVHARDGTTH